MKPELLTEIGPYRAWSSTVRGEKIHYVTGPGLSKRWQCRSAAGAIRNASTLSAAYNAGFKAGRYNELNRSLVGSREQVRQPAWEYEPER